MILSTLLDEPKSVPEAIVLILSKERALRGRDIHEIVKGRFNMNVSIQAVHKACGKLIADDVLIKDNMSFSLNQEWIESLKKFAAGVKL